MSSTTVSFPANSTAANINADVLAKMNKENGTPFAVVLITGATFTLEIDDNTIVKVAKKELDYPGLEALPVGAKIYFNEDGTFKSAAFASAAKAKVAAPQASTRTSGSFERPASKMLQR